jgi:hypothetical protein
MYQGIGHLPACLMEIAPNRPPGNSHEAGGIFLFVTKEIDQFQDFQLFREEDHRLLRT